MTDKKIVDNDMIYSVFCIILISKTEKQKFLFLDEVNFNQILRCITKNLGSEDGYYLRNRQCDK